MKSAGRRKKSPTGKDFIVMAAMGQASFALTCAKLVDLLGTIPEYRLVKTRKSESYYLDDSEALFADWNAVGSDLRSAFDLYESENKSDV